MPTERNIVSKVKVYLKKDIERVGLAGEIVSVSEGFARNFLFPKQYAVAVTRDNENFFAKRAKTIEHRKEVLESKTSMLAEKIKLAKLTIKRKMHDDGKLYGAISPAEVVDALGQAGITISKSMVKFDKSIKEKGSHKVTIKLSSKLQPVATVTVVSE